ncbi:MAG: helix-turn-helix transcriptional regulator [Euryarchaeota archaeon]|nr:helix-turn-helix transcriptional regulator [Euryarchaeota archaeon]MCD6158464.1 helix-turn-helix transcriptional regulator [Euryarchaeota archaeon]
MNKINEVINDIIRRLETLREVLSDLEGERTGVTEVKPENVDVIRVSKVLSAAAHRDRARILTLLYPDGKYFTELKKATGLANSALYFHLKVLQDSGIVEQEYSRGKYILTKLGKRLIVVMWEITRLLETMDKGLLK